MTGYLIVISSVIIYAFLPALMKKIAVEVAPWTSMAISMTFLTVASYIMGFWKENLKSFDWSANRFNILYLGIFGLINAVGFFLVIKAYDYMPLWQQVMFDLLKPIFAGVFAFLLLGEPLSWKLFVGLIFVSIGIFISTYDFSKLNAAPIK
jgi:drug/metabolite transporter (DMT)-like permease